MLTTTLLSHATLTFYMLDVLLYTHIYVYILKRSSLFRQTLDNAPLE